MKSKDNDILASLYLKTIKENTTAPAKPQTQPSVKPSTPTRRNPIRRPEPGHKPRPKAESPEAQRFLAKRKGLLKKNEEQR